jgi:amino acid adenylation domain-containing protein
MIVSRPVHEVFSEQVARAPGAVAVSGDGVVLTYRELDTRANQLAHRLRAHGVGPDVPVAILLERSPAVVVAFLAVLKAGGFYLPLHGAYPPERRQWVVDQSRTPVLVTDRAARDGLPVVRETVMMDDPGLADLPVSAPAVNVHSGALAYAMYTSGSTGHPKGVAVTHQSVLGLALNSCWATGNHERVLMLAPHAFNVSTYEIWVPLLHGGRVVVAPEGDLDIGSLRDLITGAGITALHLTAGLFRVVAEEAPQCLAGVREVLTGGDVIAPGAVARVLHECPDTVVRAMYGATEATVFSTTSPMTGPYQAGRSVALGEAMSGVTLHVLDERLDPLPPGVMGELYIGGPGLARGYLARPDLTAERFVANPYGAEGERMYRTGDLVRLSREGVLEFVGRSNDQLKILGFRVELAEVESVLGAEPSVAHAVVVAAETDSGDRRLVAYLVPAATEIDIAVVRDAARKALPEYMVPSAFMVVEGLPLTANGKIDRSALPRVRFESRSAYRAPSDPVEESLCGLFAEVLGVERVGTEDSFFDLGGHSLLAIRLISRIRSELGVSVPIARLFDEPSVAALARLVGEAAAARRTDIQNAREESGP